MISTLVTPETLRSPGQALTMSLPLLAVQALVAAGLQCSCIPGTVCLTATSFCSHMLHALQVRVLVEEGKADLGVQDRWGATPLDEAMRAGSRAVMDYLQGINAPTQKDDDRVMEFLYAASRGDTARLRHVCLSFRQHLCL